MRRLLVIAVLLGSFAVAPGAGAVTLVDAAGQPVGGKWQAWADASRVPTVAGSLLFSTDPAAIGCEALACSEGPPFYGSVRETVAAPSAQRSDFYFELGHQFDWRYLTNRIRRRLAKAWGDAHVPWLDSASALRQISEDGLEGMFAAIYADCAAGINELGDSIGVGYPTGYHGRRLDAWPTINTCLVIDRIAQRKHADMADTALAPWSPHAYGTGARLYRFTSKSN